MKTLFKHRCKSCGIKTKETFPLYVDYTFEWSEKKIEGRISIRLCKDCYELHKDTIWES